ncbi:uncharacterized protein LOC106012575 [Aplysia californica]|uniref:Uncharacterized protein LOC106012575 n=1 Tax=Aplysia californica TaxID=6500 RepID=A0ABM1A5S5_APLCA|nr:uncharacterized protein LOC106012575 [Aplysia californica]
MTSQTYTQETGSNPRQEPAIAEEEWDEDEAAQKKSSLCCLQGCLAVSAVGFSFLVALPTGIILVVLSVNNKDQALLSVGVVLVVLPVVMLVVVVVLCLNQNRLARLTRRARGKVKAVTTSSRPATTRTPSVAVVSHTTATPA